MNEPKTDKTELLFDSIAPTYDKLNHWLSLGIDRWWRRRALRWIVDKQNPQQILDIACGTGDFSIAIAQHAHPDTKILGLDLTKGMLEIMRLKVEHLGLSDRITTEQGNGEHLRYADNTFDRVSIAFGIRNFEHREQALREMLRVLRPGGRLVILELSLPSNPVIRGLYNLYFTRVLPIIGGRVSGDKAAYQYLPDSVADFPKYKEWMAVMHRCGFRQVRHKSFTFGICRMYLGEK